MKVGEGRGGVREKLEREGRVWEKVEREEWG